MPIDGVTTSTPISQVLGQPTTGASGPKNELDKDAFLKLLVAQLRYQDPTAPMDTSAFMAQTSQLTSVEKLERAGRDHPGVVRRPAASRRGVARRPPGLLDGRGRLHLQRHGLGRDAPRSHPPAARR